MTLTPHEADVLRDVIELVDAHGSVAVHRNIAEADREAINGLFVKGYVDLMRTHKEAPDDERKVVPTARGRRLFEPPALEAA